MSDQPADSSTASGTILLVDDEPSVVFFLERLLRRAGYTIVGLTSPANVLTWWPDHAGEVSLIISDVMMPGLSGPELVARLREVRADVPVLFISGYPDRLPRSGLVEHSDVLRKPFSSEELIESVRRLLDGARGE